MNPLASRVAVALFLLEGAMAHAEPPCAKTITDRAVGPATGLAAEARQAIAAGKFEEALQLFERAYCLLPEPILKHGLSSAEFNLGRCEESVRDARFWVEHAADENKEDAAHWQNEVLRQCAEVTVASVPASAKVFVDGRSDPVGESPWHGWLKSGTHAVEARLHGYDAARTQLVIPEALKSPVTVTLALSPLTAREESVSRGSETPREAARRLASEGAAAYKAEDYARALEKFGAAYRLYPAVPLLLNISRADLKLSRCAEGLRYAEQFKAESREAGPASPDSPDAWLADLQRACIEAQVDSTPPGATIWIDGQRQTSPDKTPWSGRLPIGKHKVLLWRAGYQKQELFLKVDADSPAHLALTLLPAGASDTPAAVEPPPDAAPAPAPVAKPAIASPGPAPESAPAVRLFPLSAPTTNEATLSPRATKSPVLRGVGYAGIAVGVAALVVAIALGVTDQNQTAALGRTTAARSVAQSDAALVTTRSEAGGADALFVIGGVLAAAGIPLAVVF